MALGVLSRCAACGVIVPDELSVVGFDDLLFASMSAPPLTTVAMPMEAAGSTAVEVLLALAGKTAQVSERSLATRLIFRATTAPPPRGRRARGAPGTRKVA